VQLELTAVFRVAEEGGFVASVLELPGAITQGETLDEARANLRDAVMLVIETNRDRAREMAADGAVIRERLVIAEP
jgi:predicted RNase H-like HicB family nuclease